MNKQPVVLIAGSGNVTGMNVIQGLIEKGITVIGCDFQKDNPANMLCENLVVPKADDSAYPDVMSKNIRERNVTHIIPSNDHDLRRLMLMGDMLHSQGIRLNGYGSNTLGWLNKDTTQNLFKTYGIRTPSTVSNDRDYPYILRKKIMGDNRKFVYAVKCDADRNEIPAEAFLTGIKTRYIEGNEYTIDVVCNDNSVPLAVVPRLRIEVRNGMVHHARIVKDDELIAQIKHICEELHLKGINCLQCIRNRNDDEFYFIEINPRPGSGIDLSIKGGINMPYLWIQSTLGNACNVPEPEWGLNMLRYFNGYFYH